MNVFSRIARSLRRSLQQKRYLRIYRKYKDFTMIPDWVYASNLRVIDGLQSVPGCVVECGVWRGGMSAGMVEIMGANRQYLLFDSFEGLPPAKEIDGESAIHWQADTESPSYFNNCSAEIDFAENAMKKSGATHFRLVKGWFNETLHNFDFGEPIALLRLDGDWYDSTMCCLDALAGKLAPGGIIIMDDYFAWDGCSRAVHDYLSKTKSVMRINNIHGVVVIQHRF